MSGIILPSARLGVSHRLGEIMADDMQSGVAVFVRDDRVVFRAMRDGKVTGEIEFGEGQAGQMAGFFKAGADMIEKAGGSGLPHSKIVPPSIGG